MEDSLGWTAYFIDSRMLKKIKLPYKLFGLAGLVILVGGLTAVLILVKFRQNIVPQATGCISSGTDEAINMALVGQGAEAVLCPGSVFELASPIVFTAANQKIYTQGWPTDNSRALIKINGDFPYAVNALDQSGVRLTNVRVDGGRSRLGGKEGWALLQFGGNATGQVIDWVEAFDTRSWSTLQFYHGDINPGTKEYTCSDGTVSNSRLGPAGLGADIAQGQWADGISLSCKNTRVINNTIIDATDGAIVIFGSPGSIVENNVIVAENRTMFGAISMVDYNPNNGDFTGTVVRNNVIDAKSVQIRVGIAMGPGVWFCDTRDWVNHGATVEGNRLTGRYMGYGYVADNVRDWTFRNNASDARHSGNPGSDCGVGNPLPTAFLRQEDSSSGLFQGDFVLRNLQEVIRISRLEESWMPPNCSAQQEFSGCTTRGNARCLDWGNPSFPNWEERIWESCNAACSLSSPNNYCSLNTAPYPAPSFSPVPTPVPSPSQSLSPSPTLLPSPEPSVQPSPVSSPVVSVPGDANGDGRISMLDINLLIQAFGSSPPSDLRADLNNDGRVSMLDLGIVIGNFGR